MAAAAAAAASAVAATRAEGGGGARSMHGSTCAPPRSGAVRRRPVAAERGTQAGHGNGRMTSSPRQSVHRQSNPLVSRSVLRRSGAAQCAHGPR
eukprot:scaffold104040_cov42-Phaeocystis_antarctica.AAC.2